MRRTRSITGNYVVFSGLIKTLPQKYGKCPADRKTQSCAVGYPQGGKAANGYAAALDGREPACTFSVDSVNFCMGKFCLGGF